MRQLIPILLISVSLLSCGGHQTGGQAETGDTVFFKYAKLLTVVKYSNYTEAAIMNPWKKGKVLHRYRLVPKFSTQSQQTGLQLVAAGITVVKVPLQKSVVFTSVHAALLEQLRAGRQVAGVADLKYMKVPYVKEGVNSGKIADCGDGMSPMVEKIIDAEADAILLSPFENSGGYGRLEEINIPLIECAEYMEQSPLARAEWVRFYGLLYGKEREADSLFAVVDSSYHALLSLAQTSKVVRSVLMDKQTGSVWYVPGGRSTIGRMLQDAVCHYAFSTDAHSGSLPLPFETILEKSGNADVWLLRYDAPQPLTLSQLLREQSGYSQLRPSQTGEVYGCNVMTSMFYEESPFRPDLLLQDLIGILHPDIPNLPPLRYYHKVSNK
jgi:iron complex transport system substrate-binding protein